MSQMIMNSFKCPSCGNSMQFDRVKGEFDVYTCGSCGSRIQIVSPDQSTQSVTPETLYERGYVELKSKQFSEAYDSFNRAIDRAPKFAGAYFGRCLAQNHCVDREDILNSTIISKATQSLSCNGTYQGDITKEAMEKVYKDICGKDFLTAISLSDEIEHNVYNEILLRAIDKIKADYYQSKYAYACNLQATENYDKVTTARQRFLEMSGYLDSDSRAKVCFDLIVDTKYNRACSEYESVLSDNNEESVFERLFNSIFDPDYKYNHSDNNVGSVFQRLEEEFKSLGDYEDASRMAKKCRKGYALQSIRKTLRTLSIAFQILGYIYLVVCSLFDLSDYLTAIIVFIIITSVDSASITKHNIKYSIFSVGIGIFIAVFFGELFSSDPILYRDNILVRILSIPLLSLIIDIFAIVPTAVLSLFSGCIKKAIFGEG